MPRIECTEVQTTALILADTVYKQVAAEEKKLLKKAQKLNDKKAQMLLLAASHVAKESGQVPPGPDVRIEFVVNEQTGKGVLSWPDPPTCPDTTRPCHNAS